MVSDNGIAAIVVLFGLFIISAIARTIVIGIMDAVDRRRRKKARKS